jgi:hypothetical protein
MLTLFYALITFAIGAVLGWSYRDGRPTRRRRALPVGTAKDKKPRAPRKPRAPAPDPINLLPMGDA